jgi:hypothetical protein
MLSEITSKRVQSNRRCSSGGLADWDSISIEGRNVTGALLQRWKIGIKHLPKTKQQNQNSKQQHGTTAITARAEADIVKGA